MTPLFSPAAIVSLNDSLNAKRPIEFGQSAFAQHQQQTKNALELTPPLRLPSTGVPAPGFSAIQSQLTQGHGFHRTAPYGQSTILQRKHSQGICPFAFSRAILTDIKFDICLVYYWHGKLTHCSFLHHQNYSIIGKDMPTSTSGSNQNIAASLGSLVAHAGMTLQRKQSYGREKVMNHSNSSNTSLNISGYQQHDETMHFFDVHLNANQSNNSDDMDADATCSSVESSPVGTSMMYMPTRVINVNNNGSNAKAQGLTIQS